MHEIIVCAACSRNYAIFAAAGVLAALAPAQAAEQNYPVKTIRVIVPYPPGGTSDILARLIGAKLTESWGQAVVVDNRPGASSNIGADIAAASLPTVLVFEGGYAVAEVGVNAVNLLEGFEQQQA